MLPPHPVKIVHIAVLTAFAAFYAAMPGIPIAVHCHCFLLFSVKNILAFPFAVDQLCNADAVELCNFHEQAYVRHMCLSVLINTT